MTPPKGLYIPLGGELFTIQVYEDGPAGGWGYILAAGVADFTAVTGFADEGEAEGAAFELLLGRWVWPEWPVA